MARFYLLALLLVLVLSGRECRAQELYPEDRPTVLVPLKPETRAESDRREARKLFARALLKQQEDRLLDALGDFEKARQLDPQSAKITRTLVPLYLALGRHEDALTACRKTLENDPADLETWFLYARQLKQLGRTQEALAALDKGVGSTAAEDRLDILVQMHFERGILREQAHDWAKAEAAFNEVIKILVGKKAALLEAGPFEADELKMETAKTWERIGQVCIQGKQYARAVTAILKAQECDPARAARLNLSLAEVTLAEGKPAGALVFLEKHLLAQPSGAGGYEMLIKLLHQLGRDREIVAKLERFAQADSHNTSLQLVLAREYTASRRWLDAGRIYRAQAEENPSPETYKGWFDLFKQQRTMSQALDLLDQTMAKASNRAKGGPSDRAAAARERAMVAVLRENPNLARDFWQQAVQELGRRKRFADTSRLMGILAARGHQLDAAEKLFRVCLDEATTETEAEIYGGLLTVLEEAGKHSEIVKLCHQGLEHAQATNRIMFYRSLAVAQVRLDRKDAAIAAADEVVKLAGNQPLKMHLFRASILGQCGKYEQAVKDCQALFNDYSQPAKVQEIRLTLSNIYSAWGKPEEGEKQLRLILENEPNSAVACNNLGYSMAERGKNLEEAEKLIRKAIEVDRSERRHGAALPEENAGYLDSLGWVQFRRGQLPEACQSLEKAAALSEGADDPVIWDHLGDIYFRMKQADKARSAWKKSVKLYEEKRRQPDGHYEALKRKLQKLAQESP